MSGYNALFGYPKSSGIDPGWRSRIFQLDFTDTGYTPDCSPAIPNGFDILRLTGCEINFHAEEVRTSTNLYESLSTNAHVTGGAYGVSFSASTAFQQATTDIQENNKVYTLSDATCFDYSSRFNPTQKPPLYEHFVTELRTLVANDDSDIYHHFFDSYGTHFPTEMKFGSRYTREYIMTSEQYEYISESSYSVTAQAEYEGLVSVGAGLGLSEEQINAAQNFQENVQINIYTIGALPVASGHVEDWASVVHESPAPYEYTLESIDNLFTQKYFQNSDIDYATIKARVVKYQSSYCAYIMNRYPHINCNALIGMITHFID